MGATCCFTGHRPKDLPKKIIDTGEDHDIFLQTLSNEIERIVLRGTKHFISGMALGTDIYAAEIVIKLKQKYPDITLEGAIPCENQTEKWNSEWKSRYDNVLSQLDKKTVLQSHYTRNCMMLRNRYMVDRSQTVIAVFGGTAGGTHNTVKYAKKTSKHIVIIDPKTLLTTEYFADGEVLQQSLPF